MSTLADIQHPPLPASDKRRASSNLTSVPTARKVTLLFSIKDALGALESTLEDLKHLNISLTRIESRPSISKGPEYEFFVDFNTQDASTVDKVIQVLRKNENVVNCTRITDGSTKDDIPWFPRKKSDLDSFADKVLSCGNELEADHPGFKDQEYRKRREQITVVARQFRHGMELPRVEYTEVEIDTWTKVWDRLNALWPTAACQEHRYAMPLLIQNCGYGRTSIPQLENISRFLHDCTGFSIRPVMGLLTSRDFLNALAFRVFHSTQYIRHNSKPHFTPEPDICHELLGHVPLFANPEFADFSQEIGLASLGASDDDTKRLATIYWFTVEFGLCKDPDGSLKAYGAGVTAGPGELENALSDKSEKLPFDAFTAAETEYPITSVQPRYFVSESFKDAQDKVRAFAQSLDRPFSVRYNPYTERVEVLDSRDKILRTAQRIKTDVSVLVEALEKFKT